VVTKPCDTTRLLRHSAVDEPRIRCKHALPVTAATCDTPRAFAFTVRCSPAKVQVSGVLPKLSRVAVPDSRDSLPGLSSLERRGISATVLVQRQPSGRGLHELARGRRALGAGIPFALLEQDVLQLEPNERTR
jgi:hypothetical protein